MDLSPLGLHLPDRDFFHPREMAAVRDLRPAGLLAMAYAADKGAAGQTLELVNHLGHKRLLLRIQIDRVVDLDPVWVAEQAKERALRYQQPGLELHTVIGNELNLALEGFDGDLHRVMRWLRDFALAAQANGLRGLTRIHLPAPWSGMVGEDNKRAKEYWELANVYGLKPLFDEFDAHAYGAGYAIWKDCARIFNCRPWITEENQLSMAAAAEALDPAQSRCAQAVYYFILCWENYDPGPMGTQRPDDIMSLLWHDDLYKEFKESRSGVPPLVPKDPPPMPTIQHALDLSSYQHANASELIAQFQPDHVICRLYLEIEAPSQDVSRDLVAASRAAGCSTGGYFWAYRSASPEQSIDDVIALCASMDLVLPICWIDCETYGAGASFDEGPDADWLRRARAQAAKYEMPLGIYTGMWWINEHFPGGMADFNEFIDWPLWLANYSRPPSLDWVPGVKLAAHQYTSDPVDRSIILSTYTGAPVTAPPVDPPPPPVDPCQPLRAAIQAMIDQRPYRAPARKKLRELLV